MVERGGGGRGVRRRRGEHNIHISSGLTCIKRDWEGRLEIESLPGDLERKGAQSDLFFKRVGVWTTLSKSTEDLRRREELPILEERTTRRGKVAGRQDIKSERA